MVSTQTRAHGQREKDRAKAAFEAKATMWQHGYESERNFRQHNFLARRRMVLELLFNEPSLRRCLDVGCGTGDYLPALLERNLDVWAVDAAPAMVQQVRERYGAKNPSLHLSEGDVERLPYPDGWFDAVLCIGVVEYLRDDRPSLSEIHRVLRPGGVAIITVPNQLAPGMVLDRCLYWVLRGLGYLLERAGLFERVMGRPRQNVTCFHKYYTPWGFASTLRGVGLHPEALRYCSFGSFSLGPYVPFAVGLSRFWERFSANFLLGMLGLTIITKTRKGDG